MKKLLAGAATAVILAIGVIVVNNTVRQESAPLTGAVRATTTQETLREQLLASTADERRAIKADFFSRLSLTGTFTYKDYTIEVMSLERIDDGVSVYARAWKSGEQVGFIDGTYEIEHFKLHNPPILVPDVNGTVEIRGEKATTTYRIAPLEALRITLGRTIERTGMVGAPVVSGKTGNTTDTFYPDADPESASVDGRVWTSNASWASARGATTGTVNDNTTSNTVGVYFTGGLYYVLRGFYLFNTSSLPDTDTVSSATLSPCTDAEGYNDDSDSLHAVETAPASNTALASGDIDSVVFTTLGSVTIASISNNSCFDIALNATGLTKISLTGVTKLGMISGRDLSNTAPTGLNARNVYWAEQTGTTNDPLLTVVHAAAGGGGPIYSDDFIWME